MTDETLGPDLSEAFPNAAVDRAAAFLGTPPDQIQITRLAGDASSRRYFRLAGPGERSIIAAVYPGRFDLSEAAIDRLHRLEALDPAARLTFANDPGTHIEVTRLLGDSGLPVPEVLHVDGPIGVMLTEDVGDTHLQDWIPGSGPAALTRAYEQALDFAVRIQELTEALPPGCICRGLGFDVPKLKWELDFFQDHYFNRYLPRRTSAEILSGIQHEMLALCEELASLPQVLVHRDYHARNLMMNGDNMFIIDYQDARLGPETYDLVSLLCDPYAGLSAETVSAMTDRFLGLKERSSRPLADPKRFSRDFHLMTIQRMLKAVGTYSYQAAKGNLFYIQYIQPALDWALSSMRDLGEFPLLMQALAS